MRKDFKALADHIAECEQEHIRKAVAIIASETPGIGEHEARRRAAVELLKISVATLYRKLPPATDGRLAGSRGCSVYVMRHTRSRLHKIGFTRLKPDARERTLQGQDPELGIVATYPGVFQDEARLHRRFEKKRVRGEWFKLSASDLREIAEYFQA